MTRFVRLPGTARRYLDTKTGQEISRRQYEKLRGKPLKRPKPSKVPKLPPPTASVSERIQKKAERDRYFAERKHTHRWFVTSHEPAPRGRKFGRATWGYQLIIVATFEHEKTGQIREGVMGYSFVHNDYDYAPMEVEAIREAQSRLGGSGWIHIETTDAYLKEWRHLKRTKRNYKKYASLEAYNNWRERSARSSTQSTLT